MLTRFSHPFRKTLRLLLGALICGTVLGQGAEGPRLAQRPDATSKRRIFGPGVQTNNVVFVIDISSSMVGAPKSNKTYEILEHEVSEIIGSLVPGNKFGMVVFAKNALVFRETLTVATAEEKSKAVAWFKSMSPILANDPRATEETKLLHHGTRADIALAAALKLNPEVIFFVSDGEPTGKTPPVVLAQVQEVQKANSKPVPIHAIAYLADGGQQFMKDLALQNGGTFREITPKHIK